MAVASIDSACVFKFSHSWPFLKAESLCVSLGEY